MDRKKQLLMESKYRKPEMGIISFRCMPTQDIFIGPSNDTKADINSNSFKLEVNGHPNLILQKLWNQYGKSAFETGVLEVLPYDEKNVDKKDYTKELEELCNRHIRNIPNARRIKR
jgi:hypothetical protein